MKIIENFFTEDECFDMIVKNRKEIKIATLVGGYLDSARKSRVKLWRDDKILEEKFGRSNMIFQFTEYKFMEYYDWHSDFNTNKNFNRIESFTVLLNEEFEGGNFEIENYGIVNLNRGDCLSFDSKLKHRVKTVTSGVRYSLVGWVRDS